MRKATTAMVLALFIVTGSVAAAPINRGGSEPIESQPSIRERVVKYVKRFVLRATDGGMLTIPKP